MATSRALLTSYEDFYRDAGLVTQVPYMIWDGENPSPSESPLSQGSTYPPIKYEKGTNTRVPGIVGKATKFGGSIDAGYYFQDWWMVSSSDQGFAVSMYYTPTNEDLSKDWNILLTTRGNTYNDSGTRKGIHIAVRGSAPHMRAYDANGLEMFSLESTGLAQGGNMPPFDFIADRTYHIVMRYDPSKTNKWELLVDGVPRLWSTVNKGIGGFYRDFSIGNFKTGSTYYPTKGAIDEVQIFTGANDTPTVEQFKNQDILNRTGKALDYTTEPGTVRIYKKADGTYYTGSPIQWISKTIDIGDPPISYLGRVQMTAEMDPAIHQIKLFTRTSDDGTTFSDWQAVGDDGTILSPSKRYYQIRADLSTSTSASTPVLKELEILEYAEPIQYELSSEPLRVYADLDTGIKSLGILNNAYEMWIEEEVRGQDILTFQLPMNDPKRRILGAEAVEFLLRIGDRRYVLKENKDKKDSSGRKISTFKAEAKWYELNDPKVIEYELVEATVEEHVKKILKDSVPVSGWELNLNLSSVTKKRTIRGKWKSVLALLRDVEATFGVELNFFYDVEKDKDLIDILDFIGKDKRIRFYYNKNIKEIERNIDTYGMVTRLYLYGAGELDITTVNDGIPYIENLEWVNKYKVKNKIRPDEFRDDRYTIPENLKSDGEAMLEPLSKPNISYAMNIKDLSVRSGHEPESISLGDTVYPIDEDLMIKNLPSRVMRRKYNVREPHKTEVELDQPKKQLADVQSRVFDDDIQTLTESDPVTNADIQEMTVFNHLLNSRADDGLDEWTQVGSAGITASAEGGFSGDNSFKIEANYDEYKSISQEVFNLSHRTNYTISAMVNKEGDITAGSNGFIGIRIRVKYKPDENGNVKEETKLLKIPDVTNL